jgi:ABC-type glutathione transport system ATPase component
VSAAAPLLEVRDLSLVYPARHTIFDNATPETRAVDGVSFSIDAGQTLALVGESGSGKSSLARAVLRLAEPSGGAITFDGADFLALDRRALRRARRHLQIVFQDPGPALNPRMTAGTLIREGIEAHQIDSGGGADARVERLLDEVGLRASDANRFPHEFSGGQRQRIAIARALAVEPKLIVLDEAVSALDVTVQAQVTDLLARLQRDRGLSYLFIAHNLALVERIASRVAVMYFGRIVELGPVAQIYRSPAHPHTRALLDAVPVFRHSVPPHSELS